MSSRAKNSLRNLAVGTITRIVWIFFPFIFRTIIIYTLGKEYLGLNNLFASILQVLNVADIGLGNAIQSSLYKPLSDNNHEKVSSLLNFYRKIYMCIGMIILAVSIILLPFLSYLIKGSYPSDVNIYFLFFLYAFNSFLSYTFFASDSILLNASQRMDLTMASALIAKIISSIMQLIALLYYKNIIIYVIANVCCTAIQNTLNHYIVKIKYNNLLNKKSKLDSITKKKLYCDSIGLVFQKIGGILSTSFDTIIISMFLGLSEVTIYSNYNFVAKSIGAFLDLSFEAIIASIGNSLVEESHCKNINDFNDLSFLNFWLTGWTAICLSCLIQNFEWKWTAGSIMASDSVAILIAVCFYFSYIRKIVLTYKDALGLWSEDKFKPIVGGIFNLIVNIILVNKIGIQGVIISTILSYILIEIPWENSILLKKYYKIDMRNYYLSSFYMIFCTVIAWSITYYICSFFGYEWISFFIKIIICLVVPNLIIFIMNYKRKSIKAIERLLKIILKVKK